MLCSRLHRRRRCSLSHACLASWIHRRGAGELGRRVGCRRGGASARIERARALRSCVSAHSFDRAYSRPGPDLAPFLVSLVSPPVATARYLRAAYGEHGVHITYIGALSERRGSAIDERLTPDAFLADLAEHGIALVGAAARVRFDRSAGSSPMVLPARRSTDRRDSLERHRHADARSRSTATTCPPTSRNTSSRASTCCSISRRVLAAPVAVRSDRSPPRSARVAVTAVEPPRALGPIIDQASGRVPRASGAP